MIKNLIFHIGDPKTGTSSIQRALQTRAWTCDSVSIAPQKELNASALANSLIPDRSPQKYDREFGKKKDWAAKTDADLGIISAEFFSVADPDALLMALREYLPDYVHSARVIAYCRPHASRIISSYAQRIKVGSFNGSLENFVTFLKDRPRFYYYPRFSAWRTTFGGRFTLRPFIREELRNQDIVADFFHTALRNADFSLEKIESVNETLALDEIVAMRLVQSVLIKQKVPSYLRLPIGAAIAKKITAAPVRSHEKLLLDRGNAAKILMNYRTDAEQLDAEFFDEPLMKTALVKATESAADTIQSLKPEDYFSHDVVTRIRRQSRDIAKLLNEMPFPWRRDYRVRTGQSHADETAPPDKAQQDNAAAVWGLLDQIARTLAGGRAGQGENPGGGSEAGRKTRQKHRAHGRIKT